MTCWSFYHLPGKLQVQEFTAQHRDTKSTARGQGIDVLRVGRQDLQQIFLRSAKPVRRGGLDRGQHLGLSGKFCWFPMLWQVAEVAEACEGVIDLLGIADGGHSPARQLVAGAPTALVPGSIGNNEYGSLQLARCLNAVPGSAAGARAHRQDGL